MTCVDQTYYSTLVIPDNGPCHFINFRNSYSNDTFANQFRNVVSAYSIIDSNYAPFTWPPVTITNMAPAFNYKTAPKPTTTEYVPNANGFDETNYINMMRSVNFFDTYAAQDQTVTIASVCGAVAFLLVVGALATVFVLRARRSKKQAKQLSTAQIKEYVV
jgi:hypothetical protein